MDSAFHHWNDGRGLRRVLVNGNEVRCVVWADTQRGAVLFYPEPIRMHRNRPGELYGRILRGRVEVLAMVHTNGPA